MTGRGWTPSWKTIVFWVAPLALVPVVLVAMAVTADRPDGHRSPVLHGRGTSPAEPDEGGADNGTGGNDQSFVGGTAYGSQGTSGNAGRPGRAVTTAQQSDQQQTAKHGDGGAVPDLADDAFGVVVGSLRGLYPGELQQLPVTYQNPHSFAIRVISARVATSLVTSSRGVPVCSSSHLAVSPWSSRAGIAVPRHGSARTSLALRLAASAPDSCQGARWRLTVIARAVRLP